MHPSPNILRTTVVGCEAKQELTKKRVKEEFGVVKCVVEARKGGHRENICKIQPMTKKVIRYLRVLNGNFFLKNVIRKFGPINIFSVPPKTRCQVSTDDHIIILTMFFARMF